MLGISGRISVQLALGQAWQDHFENPPGALKVHEASGDFLGTSTAGGHAFHK